MPTRLKTLLSSNKTIIAPGIFDGLSARLTEQAGFKALYASGGAIARSCGFPDLGLISISEVLQHLEQIREVTTLPIIADADTGFGNELNVRRTVKQFKRAGVSALHIEDQQSPKRCGHLDGKTLISAKDMQIKISAAKDVADDVLIIARTDAIAVEGFDAAIQRAKDYIKAGADMIFVEAPTTEEQIEKIAEEIQTPKLINMFVGGKTPLIPLEKLKTLGYQLVIIPSDLQRACIHSMQNTLKAILENGDSGKMQDQLASFQDREKIIGTSDYI